MIAKYGVGVMSKNVVDACIDFANSSENHLIFIPSRRQVDLFGGYANGWTNESFSSYVKQRTDKIFIKRDHGGPNQGLINDDGKDSLESDCSFFDAIHIDPWKIVKTVEDGCLLTKDLIEFCYSKNKNILYEVGTEESIFKYEADDLDYLIKFLKDNLISPAFANIKFAVIQSGTSLKESSNTGSYNGERLADMIRVCKTYGLYSKEHNGDYLHQDLIFEKFKCGLNSINIAPEFGMIESKTYIKEIRNEKVFNSFFNICYLSKKWEKWVDQSFDPFNNKQALIEICGHYTVGTEEFLDNVKKFVRFDIDNVIKRNITNKLYTLHR
jgi:hypothetical protein